MILARSSTDTNTHSGMRAECSGRIDAIRGSRLLRGLVEQHVVGSVRARLESTGAQLPSSSRLPLVNLGVSSFEIIGNICHVLSVGSNPRADHGMLVQEGTRVFVYNAVDADSSSVAQSDEITEGQEHNWQRGVLDRAICWAERIDKLLSVDIDISSMDTSFL